MRVSIPMLAAKLVKKGFCIEYKMEENLGYDSYECLIGKDSGVLLGLRLYCSEMEDAENMLQNCGYILCDVTSQQYKNMLYSVNSVEPASFMNAVIEVWKMYQLQERDIISILLNKKSLDDFVNCMSRFMGNPTYFIDSSFKVLAIDENPDLPESSVTWKHLLERRYMPINTILSLFNNSSWNQADNVSLMQIPEFYLPFINCRIYVNGHLQGYFFVVAIRGTISQGDVDFVEQLYQLIGKIFIERVPDPTLQTNFYEYFFRDVLSGKLTDPRLIEEQIQAIDNWKADDFYCIFRTTITKRDSVFQNAFYRRFSHIENGKPVLFHDILYVIYRIKNTAHYDSIIWQIKNLFYKSSIKVSSSEIFRHFSACFKYIEQADCALRIGIKQNPNKLFYEYKDYIFDHFLENCLVEKKSHLFLHHAIAILKDYDRDNNTDLVYTLYEYVKNERVLSKTASILNIHRNSLLYRLERIKSLTHLDLDDAEVRLHLLLSYRLLYSE